jgi:hypothetical protein
MASLRSRLRDAGNEIDRLERLERLHSSCPSLEDVSLALEANERLEEENRTLRAQLEQLRRRGRPILRRLE